MQKFKLSFLLLFSFILFANAQKYSLQFNGEDQLGTSSQTLPTFNGEFTVEAWINADTLGGFVARHTIVSTDNMELGLTKGFAFRCGNEGDLSFVFGNDAQWVQAVTNDQPLVINEWFHVAATYDSDTIRLFIDGEEILQEATTETMSDSALPPRVGKSILGFRYFDGLLDDIRIWNVVRTPSEIENFRCSDLTGNENGLLAYWKFDDDPSTPIAIDETPNGYDLNLNNNLESDWIPDDNCNICFDPSNLSVLDYTSTSATLAWNTSGFGSWNLEYALQGTPQGEGTLISAINSNPYLLNSLIPNTTYDVYLQENCADAGNSNWIGPISFTTLLSEYSLQFDGSTQVGIANQVMPALGSNITIEAWIKPYDFSGNAAKHTIVSNDYNGNGTNEGFALRCGDDGNLSISIGTGESWGTLQTNDTPLSINTWYHVAATYDQNDLTLYINGLEVVTIGYTPAIVNGTQPLRIGKSSLGPRWFNGLIDEVRVWNIARSQSEIEADICTVFEGNENGLMAYYKMDDGPLSNVLSDASPNALEIDLMENFVMEDWMPDPNCNCANSSDLNISLITNNTITFSWTSLAGSTNIEWGLEGFTQGEGMLLLENTLQESTFSNLLEETTYSFYLQDDCGPIGSSEWIGPFDITTLAPCLSPTNLFANTITDTNVLLEWTSGGSNTWNIEWGIQGISQGEGTLISGVDSNPFLLEGLESETTYTVYIQDECAAAGTSQWLGPFDFTTLVSCIAPTVFMATESTSSSIFLTWSGTGESWSIEYGPEGFILGSGTQVENITSPYMLDGLDAETSYDVYIINNCGEVQSEWVGPITFTTLEGCGVPFALIASNITNNQADLFWQSGGSDTWNIEYGEEGFTLGNGILLSDVSENPYTLSGLIPNTAYSFYVQDACNGEWAGPFDFMTLFVATNEVSVLNVVVFPNPTLGKLHINFEQNNFKKAEVFIYNTLGKSMLNKTLTNHSSILNLSSFKNGVYFVKIKMDERQSLTKLVLMK